MTDPFVLTFAEIDFLLAACPQRADAVRAALGVAGDDHGTATARAGLASLLARGLCADTAGSVTPGPEATSVIAALSTALRHIAAAGWRAEQPDVMHLYDGGAMRVALFPAPLGRYTVEFLNPEEPVSAPLMRFVDAIANSPADGHASALVIKDEAIADAHAQDIPPPDLADVSVAVSVDTAGNWALSDSLRSADRWRPTSRDQVARRIAELMDEPRTRLAGLSA